MSAPRISIMRCSAGLYEWQATWEQVLMDGDVGDNSIAGCLTSGIDVMPESEPLVEISYRGVHMGTFHAIEVRELTEGVANRIVESYGALVGIR